jgi:8-oxo-dGTP pyrophosphatase MutT (NUDIX family)
MTKKSNFIKKIKLFFRYSFLATYWFVFRPNYHGAKVVIVCGDEVLLIRHTFHPHYWTFPGGTVDRGELPMETAVREIKEELNIGLKNIVETGKFSSVHYYKYDTCYCFYSNVETKDFEIDDYEIVEARWFPLDHLPKNLGAKNARKIFDLYLEYVNK